MDREQTTIRLPAELLEELKEEAKKRGQSFNEYLIHLIEIARKKCQ